MTPAEIRARIEELESINPKQPSGDGYCEFIRARIESLRAELAGSEQNQESEVMFEKGNELPREAERLAAEKERRERIATAVMGSLLVAAGPATPDDLPQVVSGAAQLSVIAADALMRELDQGSDTDYRVVVGKDGEVTKHMRGPKP